MKRRIWLLLLLGSFAWPVSASAEGAHTASHGGALAGLEYDGLEAAHLELAADPATGALTVYLLDAEAEAAVRIPQEIIEAEVYLPNDPQPATIEFKAQENPATGETAGDTSVFAAQSDRLKGVSEFKITLRSIFIAGVEIDDTSFGYPEGTH